MIDITAHTMIRNEEYWIGYILPPLLEILDHVIIIDTGSEDNTINVVRDVLRNYPAEKSTILLYDKMNARDNGQVRQWMTDMSKTEWAMIVDGDEYYPIPILKKIKEIVIPENGKLGYTTLQVLQHKDGKFWNAERWSKQALFHVPTTTWSGAYPFEGPNWYDRNDTFFYYDCDVIGYDLHHLQRSSRDKHTPHRHDEIRKLQKTTSEFILPFPLDKWTNPYSERGFSSVKR